MSNTDTTQNDKATVEAIAAEPKTAPAKVIPNKNKNTLKGFIGSIEPVLVKLPEIHSDSEIIDAVIVDDGAPLPKAKAEALDKKITTAVGTVGNSMEKLFALVTEAKDGKIHVALGFPSWTAYFADRVAAPMNAIGERKEVAAMLHDEGMSNRAIGAVLGVSHATASNDVKTVKAEREKKAAAEGKTVAAKPGKTVGKDGKEYTRKPAVKKPVPQPKPKKSDAEIRLDISIADAENVVDDIATLAASLENLYAADDYVHGSDKEIQALIAKARKTIAATALPKAPARKAAVKK